MPNYHGGSLKDQHPAERSRSPLLDLGLALTKASLYDFRKMVPDPCRECGVERELGSIGKLCETCARNDDVGDEGNWRGES